MLLLHSYLEGCEFDKFHYWFKNLGYSDHSQGLLYSIFNICSGDSIGFVEEYDNDFHINLTSKFDQSELESILSGINSDWMMYKNRPEYLVGKRRLEMDNSYLYDKMLIGCWMSRYTRKKYVNDKDFNPDYSTSQVHRAIEWLRTTDFYSAPASSRFHENYEGGLVDHSLKVCECVVDLLKCKTFSKINIEDAVLLCLIHDWCKIGLYESYMRNVKDESGKWVQKKEFKYRDKSLTCFGHGVSSMFLAQRFFHLSVDECLALRWHMGFCRVADGDMNELQQANESFPLVHLIQFADQLSITNYHMNCR